MNKLTQISLAAFLAMPLGLPPALADTPSDILVIASNINDIVSIDPAEAYEPSSGELVGQTYDRLVQYDATDLETLAPGLATEWTADAEAKTITFTLREGVTFTSGNPLTGADVVYSWKRVFVLNKSPAAILGQIGWTPENYDEMVSAEGNTVTVRYTADVSPAFVLNVLASRPGAIVDMKTTMENEVDGDMGNAFLKANTAGTGPFVLRDYRPAEMINLVANPDYFGGAPAMRSVIVRHVAESATQRLLLETGDIDIARNLTGDQATALEGKDGIRVETFPQATVHFLSLNQKAEALQPPAVWEAARYLVNYEGMADSFLKGQMQVHQAFWPSGFPGALNDTPYSYDPEKAKQILADAGIETPFTVTLDVINADPFPDMAQSMQATFAEAGINLDILPGTGSQVITKYRARTHQAMLLYWNPDIMDPHSNAKAFAYNSNNGDDFYAPSTTWRNAWAVPDEINAETMAALAEADEATRLEMYQDLQRKVQQDSPIIMTFQASDRVALADDVLGYVHGPTSNFIYYRLVTKD
ncbi:ABC transporter substrate-binding protein [Alphaproteobacteria bacterium KMM 3653]|uniref:ABC transporter substrate-binding protein n=1 Tax=Harenicola maris TaxID=2841044 RepID=A0AAP2CTH1_9RHOB|nr:ABC transporter substrate-binding protein [Harenicola maris]